MRETKRQGERERAKNTKKSRDVEKEKNCIIFNTTCVAHALLGWSDLFLFRKQQFISNIFIQSENKNFSYLNTHIRVEPNNMGAMMHDGVRILRSS